MPTARESPPAPLLVLFWGGEGSTFLVDALSHVDAIYVPGLEPLEHHQPWMQGVSVGSKLSWLRTLFAMPVASDQATWFRSLGDAIPLLARELAPAKPSARVACVKVRPSVFLPASHAGGHPLNLGALLRFVRAHVPLPAPLVRAVVASGRLGGLRGLVDLVADAGARVVVLRRENVVREALSMYRMIRQDRSQFSDDRSASHVDPIMLDRYIREYENSLPVGDALVTEFRRRGVACAEYTYERLAESPLAVLEALVRFAGLEPSRDALEEILSERVRFSGSSRRLGDLVTNHAELLRHFAGTRYERFLE